MRPPNYGLCMLREALCMDEQLHAKRKARNQRGPLLPQVSKFNSYCAANAHVVLSSGSCPDSYELG